ncbi:TetR/AcrR family transcriptional regulator [Microbacteriaceae bacterium VKM Ac-2854]|nr:TetR/AcrR family transcriptional regulator [Microbacteriaceae bacterium VKM Ac-2854]
MRTKDERGRLIAAVADQLLEHGSSGASLRGLAKAIGTNNRMLLYYFNSKEELLSAANLEVYSRFPRLTNLMSHLAEPGDIYDQLDSVWHDLAAPDSLPFLRFFFEAFGVASHQPDRYAPFLTTVADAWPPAIIAALEREGIGPEPAQQLALQIMALWRGLQFALLSGTPREALDRAHRSAVEGLIGRPGEAPR